MVVYVLHSKYGIHGVTWTQQQARTRSLELVDELKEKHFDHIAEVSFTPVELGPLEKPVEEYFGFRGLTNPDMIQAFVFLTSEIGELADKVVGLSGDWVRNNPQDKNDDVAGEVGDVLMMLTVTAANLGIDPIKAMFEKFERKGYDGSIQE